MTNRPNWNTTDAPRSDDPRTEKSGSDQASTLRRLMRSGDPSSTAVAAPPRMASISVGPSAGSTGGSSARESGDRGRGVDTPRHARIRLARAIAITSGKGGVGKTNLAVNLAIALGARSLSPAGTDRTNVQPRRVCLLDADLGMANADVLCGLSPRATLEDVILGGRSIEEVMVLAPGGFRLVPGASGVASVANLGAEGRRRLLAQLASLERSVDLILIDTAAGIASNSIAFAAAAHTVLVAVTPEPTSITDAYGAVKTIVGKVRNPCIKLIVNMANDRDEGEEVFRRIDRVSRTFLETPLSLAGIVPFDPAVRACVKKREPFLVAEPDCPASRAIRAIARGLVDGGAADGPSGIDPKAFADARVGFLTRLAGWLARG